MMTNVIMIMKINKSISLFRIMRIKAGQMGVGMNNKIGISKWEFSNGHSTGWLFLSTLVKCCFL